MLLSDSARAAGPRHDDLPPAVLLGGTANAVSVARSLAAAGVHVVALGYPGSPVRHSRACARFVELGREDGVQARWLDWLSDGPSGAVLLPCDDDGLELMVTHRRHLTGLGYRLMEADDRVALAMLDKNHTYDLARRIGIPAPRTVTVRTAADVAAVAGSLAYPCALKPVHAHRFQRRTGTGTKAYVVHDAAELHDRFAYTREMGVEMLITEIIPGPDDQIFGYHSYLDERGEPLFGVTKRKLRQHPVGFGLGSYHETMHDAEVERLGNAFLQGVGVRGLANVEFKRDARDGVLKLIECNHRFTAPNEMIRIAGVDLARIAYNRVVGLPLPPVEGYRAGVSLWHPGKDARAFLTLRRRGELSFPQWLRSVARAQHFPLFRWDDAQPSFGMHAARARRVVSRRLARPAVRRERSTTVDAARAARPASHGAAAPALAPALGVASSGHDGR